MQATLDDVEKLISTLSTADREKLLVRLGSPAAGELAVEATEKLRNDVAWEALCEVGRRLAALPGNGMSATEKLASSRR